MKKITMNVLLYFQIINESVSIQPIAKCYIFQKKYV